MSAADLQLAAWAGRVWRFQGAVFMPRALAGDGSARRFVRLEDAGGRRFVGLYGPDRKENEAYLFIGRHLWCKGLPLPRLLAHSLDDGFFLMDDFGDVRLAELPEGDKPAAYLEAVKILARFHEEGWRGFNPAWCCQTPRYDEALIYEREFLYFVHEMLVGFLGMPVPPAKILEEGRRFAAEALADSESVLTHRDYQSRNLMAPASGLHVIDWQGARPGPAAYDLASLLEDPYADLHEALKEDCLRAYLKVRRKIPVRAFRRVLVFLGAARLMQASGAYAKLTRAGKPGFAVSMRPAAERLHRHLAAPALKTFPGLRELARAYLERLAHA